MRPLNRENHRNSRRTCPSCGNTFVAQTFDGTKIVSGNVCVECEVKQRVADALAKIRGQQNG